MKNRVSWSIGTPFKKLTAMDCDEVHINSKTLTIYNGKKAEKIDLLDVTKVTFSPLSAYNQFCSDRMGQ
jgi:hypothetical protein